MFLFDESPQTLLSRCDGLQRGSRARRSTSGTISIQQIDPAELTPGEFVHAIRSAVEQRHAKIVVIDSLNGYLNAMPEERFLTIQLHELLMYLGQRGVATILIGAQQGFIGSQMNTPVDASYLADAVVLLRYFETRGEVRQAISVMKKRGSKPRTHDSRVSTGRRQSRVGEALREFRGILTGVPVYEGSDGAAHGEDARHERARRRGARSPVLVVAPTSKDAAITQAAARRRRHSVARFARPSTR